MKTTHYTARDLLTLLARLIKPITDAINAELRTSRPAANVVTIPNPGRKVVGLVAEAAPVEPVPVAEVYVPENAAALSIPAGTVPSMAPWLEITPIATKPARKPRKATTPKRDESGTHGVLNWQAESNTVVITAGRTSCSYAVTETPTDWNGRAFKLDKLDAGTDPESRSYSVFVCKSGTSHRCDCKGFEKGNGKPCKHINSLKALAATARV